MSGIAQISPNLRRERIQIDSDGNEVVPFTRQVVKPANEGEYVPTKEEREAASAKPAPTPEEIAKARQEIKEGIPQSVTPEKSTGGLDIEGIISKKIEALIEKKVNDVLEKMLK